MVRESEDNLSPTSITHHLKTHLIGQRVIYYPSLTSTMEIARQEAQQGAIEGTVVIAGEQTGGRGRMKRTWLSPRGNLALSVILYPSISSLPFLIMLSSVAVVRSIKNVTNLRAQVKWPNDILVGDKKVAGILTESGVRGGVVDYATIGIGINVNLKLADFPALSPLATSLSHELGRDVSQLHVIRQLLFETERLYLTLPDGEPIYEEWRDNLVTLGKKVTVKSGRAINEGIAESVATDGSLLLRRSDGVLLKIVAGEATLHA